ncbi:hypothetical protein XELAEV_18047933mg [Xenopus laevis]|uniref:Uncharacterized protein n=1 Tax=Xenopus laevis TaxID=8355 RepID=A0A974BW52_XENLA|nr:hypothetical protein XELAEV_18047933mg [Xenopus laevis]
MEKKPLLGIFSRDNQTNYQWLIDLAHPAVPDIRPMHIANDEDFREEVHKCTVAILYHTVTKERINITNVMDSLYDDELQYLYKVLGKKNVIVVIDDLEDSSSAEKDRILKAQPRIGHLARDVFLFSTLEKERIPLCNQQKNVTLDPKVAQLIRIIKDHQRRKCDICHTCRVGVVFLLIAIVFLIFGVIIYTGQIPCL